MEMLKQNMCIFDCGTPWMHEFISWLTNAQWKVWFTWVFNLQM